jgi:hypothetical protein
MTHPLRLRGEGIKGIVGFGQPLCVHDTLDHQVATRVCGADVLIS